VCPLIRAGGTCGEDRGTEEPITPSGDGHRQQGRCGRRVTAVCRAAAVRADGGAEAEHAEDGRRHEKPDGSVVASRAVEHHARGQRARDAGGDHRETDPAEVRDVGHAEVREEDGVDEGRQGVENLGFSRIVASDIEAPNMLVNLV
jgi:hypothetical protein